MLTNATRTVALLGAVTLLGAPAAAQARPKPLRDGVARFEVLTPSLIRLEYAPDRRFENRPTMTARRTGRRRTKFRTGVKGNWRSIRTSRVTLRWRRGTAPFSAGNLRLTLGKRRKAVSPGPGPSRRNLGGWTRALDLLSGPVPLHDGVLSRDGWYMLDDTRTVLLTDTPPGFAVRPAHTGGYQDLYLFAYGRDLARGLRDLRALTGPAPLLPRGAFGVWFSKYYPYSESELRALVGEFRTHRVPLDTLSIDTDFKRVSDPIGAAVAAAIAGAPGKPFSWNGWEWNTTLFPDPERFTAWAHGEGLSLAANLHPSINTRDPRFAETQAAAGPLASGDAQCKLLQADTLGSCRVFDWTNLRQLAAYFKLHEPFARQGIDLFWLDWCCEGPNSAVAPGLAGDTWINSRYAAFQRARGQRWPAFARIGASYAPDGVDGDRGAGAGGTGALAEHRYTIQFTGDTCATWSMLAFEANLTASEGNIGLPYVSHDIGSFNGAPRGTCTGAPDRSVPDDLYTRWVQFGAFQPLDRLHSHHGRRLPWEYRPAVEAAASRFLRLRGELVPYTYTLARRAHDTGLPIAGPLYLQWPRSAEAYRFPSQYTYGRDIAVAPVTAPGDPAPATVWVPPGKWVDFFTGERFTGPAVRRLTVPLSRIPVLVRAGAVIPTQPDADHTPAGPNGRLILTAYRGRRGGFTLYDDAGTGFGYEARAYTRTRIRQVRRGGRVKLTIGPGRGRFHGALRRRAWTVRLLGVSAPRRVRINGRVRRGWTYDRREHTLTVATGRVRSRRRTTISVVPR